MPRKPHPFGDEYHTIGCVFTGIVFDLEMIEEKVYPPELKKKKGVKKE